MGEVIPWPKDPEHRRLKEAEDKRQYDEPAKTLIISDGVFSMPPSNFPFPSAPAVCPKYLKALEEQKAKTK